MRRRWRLGEFGSGRISSSTSTGGFRLYLWEIYEALRKDGFQSLFVAPSEAWEAFLRIDASLLRAACWTVASGMRLACEGSMRRDPKVRLMLWDSVGGWSPFWIPFSVEKEPCCVVGWMLVHFLGRSLLPSLSSAACVMTVTLTRPLMTYMIIPLQPTCPSHLL